LLAQFGRRRARARAAYAAFVADGLGAASIWDGLRGQIYLGGERFVERMLKKAKTADEINVPRAQRRGPAPSLGEFERRHGDRDAAMAAAWASGGYSYTEIAQHFGVHFTTVGRAVRRARERTGRG